MNTKKMKTLLPSFILVALLSAPSYAQVTIGSDVEPLSGAILDLKQEQKNDGSANTTKGMMLPRVNLTNLTDITADITGVTAGEDPKYTGLTVYNINECVSPLSPLTGKGVYVWNGAEWQPLMPWASGVQKHAAKPGVYEEFYSAEFGAAGRWMTTNLTAWKYDTNIPPATAALPATPNVVNSDIDPYWCYPNGGTGGGATSSYDNNPHLGLLYNWPAATTRNTGTADEGNTGHADWQGICPNGWHVPSDYEWNELEKEIYEHPERYSSYADNSSFPNGGSWDPAWDISPNGVDRPNSSSEAHGKAMKSVCGFSNGGLSNNLAQNGFNALPAGFAFYDATTSFGDYAYFWCSSSGNVGNSYARGLSNLSNGVSKENQSRNHLFSVRCKKD